MRQQIDNLKNGYINEFKLNFKKKKKKKKINFEINNFFFFFIFLK